MSIDLPDALAQRRQFSDDRLSAFISELNARGARQLTSTSACVYATGSVARGEASPHSDLDLFIVARGTAFNRLKQLRLKATLIDASSTLEFPEFSGDGEYLDVHSAPDLADQIGSRDEDVRNVLTARLLLLLESRPVIGEGTYRTTIRRVVDSYWRDYGDHGNNFMPIFLMNDIMRFWKMLCLNYEARTYDANRTEIAKRRVLNYKLKFSRMLTCYSALAFLCHVYRIHGTITREAMIEISSMTPLERLARLGKESREARKLTGPLLAQYEGFLETTASPRAVLFASFSRSRFHEQRRREAQQFGDDVFRLLTTLAGPTRLLRYLLV